MRNGKNPPKLATANAAFTPMTHRTTKNPETPFNPLKIDDLDTPIKSSPNNSESEDIEETCLENLQILFTNGLKLIETLSKARKQSQKKKLQSIETQTLDSSFLQDEINATPRNKIETDKPKRYTYKLSMADNTEVTMNDESLAPIGSPTSEIPGRKQKNLMKIDDISGSNSEDDATLDGSPVQHRNISRSSIGSQYNYSPSTSKKSEADDLQKRIRAMSLVLRNLENQIDNMF